MIKNFLAICILVMSFGAHAQSINVENLSPSQIAELNRRVADMKKDPSGVSEKVRSEVEAWTDLGQNIGRATVGAAKEIGIAANEFAQTPLGIITTAIVVYKLIGQDMKRVVVGSFLLLFGTILGSWIARRRYIRQYEYKPVLFGAFQWKRITSETHYDKEDGFRVFGFFLICASWLFGSMIIL